MQLVKSGKLAAIKAQVILPASKSEANRALILEAYTGLSAIVENSGDAADVLQMKRALLDVAEGKKLINIRDAGTVGRFIIPLLCMKSGSWTLTGEGRMLERPYASLINALRQLGADIKCTGKEGFLPLKIKGGKLSSGRVSVGGSESSQFISALMLAAPFVKGGLEIDIVGKAVSFSYLRLTAKVLQHFGAKVELLEKSVQVNEGITENTQPYVVAGDWSSATYWLAALALMPESSELFFPHLSIGSEQGDVGFLKIVENFGVKYQEEENGLKVWREEVITPPCLEQNMSSMPDAVPTLAVLCALANVPARFLGISHLRHKESDRLLALTNELRKIGVQFFEITAGWDLKIENTINEPIDPIEVYNDHRMAMAFALLSLVFEKVDMNTNPYVTTKSYPGFWESWEQILPVSVNQ